MEKISSFSCSFSLSFTLFDLQIFSFTMRNNLFFHERGKFLSFDLYGLKSKSEFSFSSISNYCSFKFFQYLRIFPSSLFFLWLLCFLPTVRDGNHSFISFHNKKFSAITRVNSNYFLIPSSIKNNSTSLRVGGWRKLICSYIKIAKLAIFWNRIVTYVSNPLYTNVIQLQFNFVTQSHRIHFPWI